MNVYIGARYLPIIGRKNESSAEWDNSEPYEPLTVVLYQGNSYTSRQYVPTGIDISNTEYWIESANYNAQVAAYRHEVSTFDGRITDNEDAIAGEVTARENAITTEAAARNTAIEAEATARANADTALQNADTALSGRITTNSQAISAEEDARLSADTALSNRINTEIINRESGDSAINAKLGSGFSSTSTVRSQLDAKASQASVDAKASQTALDALAAKLPSGSFTSTNTVKKYIDNALESVSPLHYFGVIGDSFSDGNNEWPTNIRARSNWVPVVVAKSGSGFAPTSGSVQVPFIQQLRNLAANALWPKIEKIIVYGAHNDWADTGANATTTRALLSEFVTEWYNLTTSDHRPQLIFVLGNCGKPERNFSRTYGGYPEYINALVDSVRSWGYTCIPAYAWLLGLSDAYFQDDNLHPTELGHRVIGSNMLGLLTGTYTDFKRRRSYTTNETGWKDTKVEVDISDTTISMVVSAKKDGQATLDSGNLRLSTIPHLWFGNADSVYDSVQLLYNVIFARYYNNNFEVLRSLYNPLVGYVGLNLQTQMNVSDNYNIAYTYTLPIV